MQFFILKSNPNLLSLEGYGRIFYQEMKWSCSEYNKVIITNLELFRNAVNSERRAQCF